MKEICGGCEDSVENSVQTQYLASLQLPYYNKNTTSLINFMGKAHFPDRDMRETGDTKSGIKMDEHEDFIQKFVSRGYKIISQEDSDEKGLDQELLSETLTTVLQAENIDLPMIKFEAKQVFGKYDYENQQFTPFEAPKFILKSYTKSARIEDDNAPWKVWDMD